jgi:hypothetical protein
MTIGVKLQQTIASSESVMANLKTFALDTQDQQAKDTFNQLASNMQNVVNELKGRMNYIEDQEPQYKEQ